MSYHNGYGVAYSGSGAGGGYTAGGAGVGGGRGRRRDDHQNRRGGGRGGYGGVSHGGGGRSVPESTAVRLRKMVIKFGDDEEFDPVEDAPRLAKVLRRGWREGVQGVLDGFRYGISEQPFKHHYYVSLLLELSHRPVAVDAWPDVETSERPADEPHVGDKRKADDADNVECGREVLEDLGRAFRVSVEGREWLHVRLCLQFFSLLVPAGLVTPHSLLDVYKGLLAVLNEVGGGGDRAERAVRAVGEGLIRSAHVLYPAFPEEVESLIGSIEMFVLGRRGVRALVNPLAPILAGGLVAETYADTLSNLLSALYALRASDYTAPEILSRPWEAASFPDNAIRSDPYVIAAVSMPPEMYDVDEENPQAGEGQTGGLRVFSDDIVPAPDTVLGWTLRSLVLDMIAIFEVNRKDCARLLLALPRYLPVDTFKTEGSTSTYSLESLVVSTLLATLCTLPLAPQKSVYYGSVITELCKLSPSTVAPPVGRAVRKIFNLLGAEGLDVEIAKRVSEWFATHLSNFGFQWMWKEWIPELELPAAHPKRAFMRRVVQLETRLAYHDRILQTLPEPMLSPEAAVVNEEEPDPVWPYERDEHPLHAEAVEILRMLRQKAGADEIKNHLENLPNARSGQGEPLAPEILLMAIETILHLGSRSFSHFLNATERYLDVLRHLSPDPASRRVLLDAVQSYWRFSSQMRLITVDKYLQYGVLEPVDVINWVFADDATPAGAEGGDGWTDGDKWEMMRMTLDKVVGRVVAVRRRLRAVDKSDEVARARRAAERLESGEGVGMDDDVEDDATLDRSREGRDAQASLDLQTTRLERVFVAVTKHFVTNLLPWAFDATALNPEGGLGLKAVLALLDSGEVGDWPTRARWGWWREFVRLYSQQLEPLGDIVESSIFSSFPSRSNEDGSSLEARAESMVKRVWSEALGRE